MIPIFDSRNFALSGMELTSQFFLSQSGLFPELNELTGNLILQATFFPMLLELRVLYAFTGVFLQIAHGLLFPFRLTARIPQGVPLSAEPWRHVSRSVTQGNPPRDRLRFLCDKIESPGPWPYYNIYMISLRTSDGVLVADKEMSPHIKELVAPFEGRPMFEERRWGLYRVMDCKELFDGTEDVDG